MSSDPPGSAEQTFGLPESDEQMATINPYKSSGMVDEADAIVADESKEGFRRVERADGTIERHYTDSIWIIALDGTTTTWRPDQTATVFHPDGARTEVDRAGNRYTVRSDGSAAGVVSSTTTDADGTLRSQLADGGEVLASVDGTFTLVLTDGTTSVTRTDGTVERISEESTWETGVDGTTVIRRIDGSVSTIHPDGSRTDVSPDGGVVEIDSGERRALSDEILIEEPPERSPWIWALVPAAVLVLGLIVTLVLLGGDDTPTDTSFVVPEAAEAMRDAPAGFDLVAWCGDVTEAMRTQIALDRALARNERKKAARASASRITAIETASDGAPPELDEDWQRAAVVVAVDAAALEQARHRLDRYLLAQAEGTVPAGALDQFLVEQVDACVAAEVNP